MSPKSSDVPLSAADRDALVRAVFDASKAAAWTGDWQEKRHDPVFAGQPSEQLRDAYFNYLEKLWPEWKSESRDYSNSTLLDLYADAVDQCDALALLGLRAEKSINRHRDAVSFGPTNSKAQFDTLTQGKLEHTAERNSVDRGQER